MLAHVLLKLIGVAIIVVGSALKLRTTLVVVVAALATGLVAELPLFTYEGIFQNSFWQSFPLLTKPGQTGIINILGKAFADQRLMTLFIITLPAIGLCERFGLQEQSAKLIRGIKAATVGRLQIVYQLFRVLHGAIGIRLNGHPSFVRPLVFPMSLGAANAGGGTGSGSDSVPAMYADDDPTRSLSLQVPNQRASEPTRSLPLQVPNQRASEPTRSLPLSVPNQRAIERIKAANAAAENYGNFYGQNLSPVQAGILLVYGVMNGLGFAVGLGDLIRYTTPVVVASILFAAVQFWLLDRWLKSEATR